MSLYQSDIEDWTPDNTGAKKQVNATTWGNIPYQWPEPASVPQKTESQGYIYWMQNMPGLGNRIRLGGRNQMTNWWVFTGDWDRAISSKTGLYQ